MLLAYSNYMDACRRQWMPFQQPFSMAGERFVENRRICNYAVNFLNYIIPSSLSALGQPRRMAAHVLDWGDSFN
jgi:hypothetical protein